MSEPYIVKQGRHGYTIYNNLGEFDTHHGHINKLDTCEMLIKLIKRNEVPKKHYLRECCLRICMDKKYLEKVRIKIDKDRNKKRYYNVNNGARQ